MRKQVKALIWASSVTAVATTGIFLGTHFYGKTDAAKGTKIHFTENRSVDFKDYQFQLIDGVSGSNEVIWEFNKDDKRDPDSPEVVASINQVVEKFKQEHGNMDPIFRITKGFFKMNNKYIDAVSVKDWMDFTFWYLGSKNGVNDGHLAFGPESSSISTFEIVPGIDAEAGGAVILGGRDSSNNEYDKITFYPDAFFGTFSLYDNTGSYFDRLVEPMFPNNTYDASNAAEAKEFTLEEAQKAIELMNKVNTFNKDYIATTKHLDPRIAAYWNNSKWGANSFTFNGSNAPAPYAIVPGSNKDGVQYYKIYSELFSRKDPDKDHLHGQPSLLRAVAAKYPSLLQTIDSPYIQYDESTGEYHLKNGPHQEIPFAKQIGLPYILKTMNPEFLADGTKNPKAFEGFGTDFLKYVSIHEYGHHITLIGAADASEGGANMGGWNGRQAPSATGLDSFDILNKYLKARSAGLLAIKTDQYGNPIDGWQQYATDAAFTAQPSQETKDAYNAYNTSYWAFAIPALRKDSNGAVLPGYTYHIETIDDVTADEKVSRAFRLSIQDLKQSYVEAVAAGDQHLVTTLYNAYIQNSFDTPSGTLNPASENGPFQFAEAAQLDQYTGKLLIQNMSTIWGFLGRQISKYELQMITNAINSTARRADPAKLTGHDLMTWPETEIRNFISYLNFLYKKPEGYNWGFNLQDKMDPKNEAVANTMILKFFHFYTDEDFLKTWLQGGSQIQEFLDAIAKKANLPAKKGEGFDPNAAYAVMYGRRTTDTVLDTSSLANPDNAFYNNVENHWSSFEDVIKHWTDGSTKTRLFKAHDASSATPADFTYDSVQEFKDWNPYDGFTLDSRRQLSLSFDFNANIWEFKDKDNKSILVHQYKTENGKQVIDETKPMVEVASTSSAEQIAEAKATLTEKIKHLLNTQMLVEWSIGSAQPDSKGRVPFKSDLEGIFANYVYSYAEAMTRDYVQSTFWFNKDEYLRNTDPMIGITASDTSFEYYVNADLSKIYATHDDNGSVLPQNFITETDAEMWIKPIAEAIRLGDEEAIANTQYKGASLTLDSFERELIQKMDQSESTSGFLSPEFGIEPYNSVFGHDKFLSNGYENDHAQKVVNGQQLYYDNQAMIDNEWVRIADWFKLNEFGNVTIDQLKAEPSLGVSASTTQDKSVLWNQIVSAGKVKELVTWFAQNHDTVFGWAKWEQALNKLKTANAGQGRYILPIDFKDIYGPAAGKEMDLSHRAETWAQAYWYFMLADYGVGDRTIASEWRDSEVDKNIIFGYIPTTGEYAKIHSLLFTNTQTGEKVTFDVYTQGTNNLFYLQNQGDLASRVNLLDEGYTSWTTDRNAIGIYLNAKLTATEEQQFKVDFVDADGKVLTDAQGHSLFTMGSRQYIAENGKYYRTAPTYFERMANGEVIFHVKPQFNI